MSDNTRVLVTGANGFVGRYLTRALAEIEPSWAIIRVGGFADTACDFQVDIRDGDGIERLIAEVCPTAVVHLAAVAAVGNASSDPRLAWTVNVDGTLNLVVAIRKKAPAAHLLYVSSAEVYGSTFAAGVAVDEEQRMQPLNLYAASKAASEVLVSQAAREGMKATIARPFNHTGPGQSVDFVMPAFAEQVAAIEAGKRPAVVKVGNLEEERDISDVRDIVTGYVRILQRADEIPSGSVFNFASGHSIRIAQALQLLLAMSNVSIAIEVDPIRYRPSRVGRVLADINKAKRELGWKPAINLNETLAALLDHHRAAILSASN